MIKSMTAYSRASTQSPFGRLVVEIHSVNRKMLDLSIYAPKDFLRFDIDMRKTLSRSLERGQVTLRLTVQSEGFSSKLFSTYASQLKILKEGWDKLAKELGYDPARTVDLPFLTSQMQSVPSGEGSREEEEEIRSALLELIETALHDLMQMKEKEGSILALDIQKRLKQIEESIAAIEHKKELPLVHYQKKLTDRLREIGHPSAEVEERVAREIALLCDKMDVTEELVRLSSHIAQFRSHLLSQEKAVGRTLDFLTQEMQREINTLGAKSSDNEISSYVVKMKSELDKIREQVQNIE